MNRYEKYKDSGIPWIGEIPQRWEVVPHKQVMSKLKEIQETYSGEDIISLTMKGVVVRNLDNGGKIPMSFDGYQKVYPDNLLLCLFDIDVTPRCVGLIKNIGVTSPAYSQFTLKDNRDSHYYDYLLRYIDDNKCFLHLSKNLRNSLTESDLGQIPTVAAPKSEQRAIADFLDVKCAEVDELIGLQEQMIDELKAYKQSVITEAVTKGLNPDAPLKDSGIEWIEQIPEHWSVERLKNRIYKSFAGIWGDDAQNNVNDVRCYRVADFDYNQLNISDDNPTKRNVEKSIFEQRKVSFDDILLEKSGGGEKSPVGRAVYVNLKEDAICSNFVHCIKADKTLTSKFLVYVLCNMYNRKVNLLYFNQTTGIQNLNVSDYLNNKVGFPPTEEQQQIADYLDTKCVEIDEMINIKQQKIEQLKEYKKSIIYEYVTGKKQVNIE